MKTLIGFISIVSTFLCLSAKAEVSTVSQVDLNKYIGKWYEVASIPQSFQKQCIANTSAEYSFAEKGRIKVYNSCDTATGKRSASEGRAEVTDTRSNSKLKVTFVKFIDWIFAFGGNYWILDLAPDYSYALVGDPTTKYAWILSRTPSLPLAVYIKAEAKFRSEGYDTCQILTSVQTGGYNSRIPLCRVVSGAKDIIDVMKEQGNFTTFLAAIQLAGVEDDLRNTDSITLFAPSDEAFAKWDQASLADLLSDKDQLKDFVSSHVTKGLLTYDFLTKQSTVIALNGSEITLKKQGATLEVGKSKVTRSDIQSANGIIHILDLF